MHHPRGPLSVLFGVLALAGCATSAGPGSGSADLATPAGADLTTPVGVYYDLSGVQPPGNDLTSSNPGSDLVSAPSPDLLSVAADMAPITNCSIVPQSGCPGGDKCTTRDTTTTLCQPAGPDPRGTSECSVKNNVDSCAAGSTCIDEGGGNSQCRAFCNKTTDCGQQSFCDFTLGSFQLCTQPCDAVYPGNIGCGAGLGCYAYAQEHTDCEATGTGADGDSCTTFSDCLAGMMCFNNTCHRVCAAGNAAACTGLEACRPVNFGSYNWITYGICCSKANGC